MPHDEGDELLPGHIAVVIRLQFGLGLGLGLVSGLGLGLGVVSGVSIWARIRVWG